jgi:hypothetical protein
MKLRFVPLAIAIVVAAAACTETSGPAEAGCNRGTLTAGGTVSGTLASGTCTGTGEFARTYVDYTTTVSSGKRYLFTLRSDAPWPPILQLINDADPLAGARTGWSDEILGTGGHSQLMFVSPYNGPVTLRVSSGVSDHPGAYTLRSSQCGGSDLEIGATEVSAQASIDANDCVIHDRFMDADSAHGDTFILYLGRNESKTIKIKARGASAGVFKPAFVLTGPFVAGSPSTSRQYTVTSLDSLSVPVDGGNVAGDYMLAVLGAGATMYGDYTLTVGPTPP